MINNIYQNVIHLAPVLLNVQLKIELKIKGFELHPLDLME
jgi:hypothetical protein